MEYVDSKHLPNILLPMDSFLWPREGYRNVLYKGKVVRENAEQQLFASSYQKSLANNLHLKYMLF